MLSHSPGRRRRQWARAENEHRLLAVGPLVECEHNLVGVAPHNQCVHGRHELFVPMRLAAIGRQKIEHAVRTGDETVNGRADKDGRSHTHSLLVPPTSFFAAHYNLPSQKEVSMPLGVRS